MGLPKSAMGLNLIKLCVGIDAVGDLARLQAGRLERDGRLVHRTRQMPRRRAGVLDGGSIYWVIRGEIQVRQPIADLAAATGEDGRPRCDIVLDPNLVLTRPMPRRPFQGWRYLDPADAPADLGGDGDGIDGMPEAMRRDLAELGLL